MKIEVIIPAYRPGPEFEELLVRLEEQRTAPERILVINTEEKYWNSSWEKQFGNLEVKHIKKEEFDHGGTRRMAVGMLQKEDRGAVKDKEKNTFYLCMTQDAAPVDDRLLERLASALLSDETIGAVYARQMAGKNAGLLERIARQFNYPPLSHVRRKEDIPRYGIKTYFCSNVCAMWRREAMEDAGGFTEKAVFNEDMILSAGLIERGWGIAYEADAGVYHSHDYSLMQQFHRNFDLGVSQAEHPEIFEAVPSEGEGLKFVKYTVGHLIKEGHFLLLIYFFLQCFFKYAGFFLGKHYKNLPGWLIRFCSTNPGYFDL